MKMKVNLTRKTESYRMEDGVKTGGENGTTGTKWCTTTPTGTIESANQKGRVTVFETQMRGW